MIKILKPTMIILFEGTYLGGTLLRLNDRVENYRWLRFVSDGVNPSIYDCPVIKTNDFYNDNPHGSIVHQNLNVLIYKDRPYDIFVYPDNIPNKKIVRVYGII